MKRYFEWLASEQIVLQETALTNRQPDLLPEETVYVRGAVPHRIAEFSAGRACARNCMAELGYPAAAIPVRSDRLPLWPDGLVGSITHMKDHCAVAMGRRSDGILSIGIDLEPADNLPADILDIVCFQEERSWLKNQPPSDRGVLAHAIFSAKECAYKVQYPLSGQILEFEDFQITFDLDKGLFRAIFTRASLPFEKNDMLTGHIKIGDGGIASAIVLRDRNRALQ